MTTTILDDEPGLFARTLHSTPEDKITELLAWLLGAETTWRAALDALFPGASRELGRPQNVETQFIGRDGRPDLVIEWKGERRYVEVKFWAALTAAQQKAYRRVRSKATEKGRLWFLGPEARRDPVLAEVRTRDPDVAYISWTEVYGRLTAWNQSRDRDDSRARYWLEELIEAIDMEAGVSNSFRPFAAGETVALAESVVPDGLGNALNLVEALYRHFSEHETYPALTTPRTSHSEGLAYGFHVAIAKDGDDSWAWVGFWIHAWRLFKKTPLWVQLGPAETFDSIGADAPELGAVYDGSYSYLVPLAIEPGQSEAAVAKALESKLETIVGLLYEEEA